MGKWIFQGLGVGLAVAVNLQAVWAQDVSLHVDFTGSSFDAKSHELQGEAVASGKKVSASRLVLNLNTLKSGVALRDKHLWKYLEVEKYPQAVLSNVLGEDGKFKGDLTLHGVTHRGVEGEFTVAGNKVNASFKTKISDYRIEPPTYMGGTITVEDEVEIKAVVPVGTGAAAPANPAAAVARPSAKPASSKPPARKKR